MELLLAGVLNFENCLSVGQLVKLYVDITSRLNQNISTASSNKTNENINTIIEEYNLECMIKVVQSLTSKFNNLYSNENMIETNLDKSIITFNKETMNKESIESKHFLNKDPNDSYVIIPDKQKFLQTLSPEHVVMYYLCESMIKINDLLNSVNQKNKRYNNSYFALSKPDFKDECIKLKSWAIQLKERLALYNIIKK